jgi:SAM-dependent methyltransferase
MDLVIEEISGRTLLDIGVVEHDASHMNSPAWKHAILKSHATECVGVDILADEVAELKKRGFNVCLADATSPSIYLGRKFDRIFIGDVIEHVDNPRQLLEFARRHLEDDGEILVTTPCPFWFKHLSRILWKGTHVPNADHVSWVTPALALELGHRAGLDLSGYWQLQGRGSSVFTKMLHALRDIRFKDCEIFAWAYLYTYKHRIAE